MTDDERALDAEAARIDALVGGPITERLLTTVLRSAAEELRNRARGLRLITTADRRETNEHARSRCRRAAGAADDLITLAARLDRYAEGES